jgi:hypothetical protein
MLSVDRNLSVDTLSLVLGPGRDRSQREDPRDQALQHDMTSTAKAADLLD